MIENPSFKNKMASWEKLTVSLPAEKPPVITYQIILKLNTFWSKEGMIEAVEIVAPDNRRKISKYRNGPDWVFNMSSLMQVGPKENDHTNNRNTAVGSRENPTFGTS